MRALERLFIFAIVSIASLLVFNLHEKHAELHKRDGEWSVRKDLQQVVAFFITILGIEYYQRRSKAR